MKKTLSALDDLCASVIALIPTWLSMLKSTRFLTLIGTGVLVYFTIQYDGLTENQMLIVTAVESALGISFTGFKTLRPSKVETAAAAPALPVDMPAADDKPALSTGPLTSYNAPIDVESYIRGLGCSLYDQFAECKNLISNYNLLNIHPDIRVTVAEQVVDKAVALGVACWPSVVGTGPDGRAFYRAPEAADYKDYASRQSFDKAVRDAIPGCQYMPEGANVLFRDLEELYSFRSSLTLLEGKAVRWYEADGRNPRIRYIYTLASLGLAAVA